MSTANTLMKEHWTLSNIVLATCTALMMYGGIALLLLCNPVNQDLAIGTVFTMLTYVSLGFFRLWQKSLCHPQ
ncbi:MAG: hypothetical protein R3E61_01235 [Pseudomonadales bacterium]